MRFRIVLLFVVVLFKVSASSGNGVDTELEKERTRRILLEDNYYTIVSRLDSMAAKMSTMENAIATLSHEPVAFKAHMTKSFTPLQSQLIEFDDVQFNLGHAYHSGTFIAPYNGTYLFSVAICSHAGHWVVVNLMRNGAMIGQVLAGDDSYHSCNSETTITELNAADDVNVHFDNSGDSIIGSNFHLNSFTGVLLSVLT